MEVQAVSHNFAFTIDLQVNGTSKGKYVSVASANKVLVLYHRSAGDKDIEIDLPSGITGLSATLYGPFTSPTYTGGSAQGLAVDTTRNIASLAYNTGSGTYYYLEVSAASLFSAGPQVSIKY